MLEFSLPLAHYFDGSPTNWLIWFPSQRHRSERSPPLINLQYTRWLDAIHAFRVAATGVVLVYYQPRQEWKRGDAAERHYIEVAVGYLHAFWHTFRLRASALGELTYRDGFEIYHRYYYQFERHVHGVLLRDMGLSLGAHLDMRIYRFVNLFSELKYTRQLLRKDRGDPPYYTGDKGSSRNILTFKLGLGIHF